MAASVQSHNPLQDPTVDHPHVDPNTQSLNQALDPHLSQVGLDSRQHYHPHYSPAHIITQDHASQAHRPDHLAFYPSAHELSAQPVDRQQNESPPKRKQVEAPMQMTGKGGDNDTGGSGARHWTDEEKTKLFNWLMGPGEDEHFDALRTKKNTCFRDCALDAFGGRKTFLAVKGCYERNFVVFKQIYAFETFTTHMQHNNIDTENEVDRLREYERRIYAARKSGFHVGNLSSRILDHWHRMGWYNVFYQRWHGDPGVADESQIEPTLRAEGTPLHDRAATTAGPSHERYEHEHANSYSTHDAGESMPSPPHTPSTVPANQHYAAAHGYTVPPSAIPGGASAGGGVDQNMASIATMAQTMMSACMRLLQAQAEDSKIRLEYLRRREEREEEESRMRAEIEKRRQEREAAEWERIQQNSKVKQRSELATELLSNPNVDGSVKQAAGDYLKKLFANVND
ncbi:hypothetical protein EW146_g223 [Bondarzewia mesenterica]|uniref:Uncharacterized protein n=1 Tax=Bondarzewia mesenterica TaxID=1095465 RepID=A0A4S4M9I5_9AGAM|nr:hypothetical protein EW146_g223 [Bondarzewia mesenterica]